MENDRDYNGFSLPPGYPESARKKITDRILILEEIRGFRILSGLTKKNYFDTPADYFEVTTEVRLLISVLQRDTGGSFDLPEDYSVGKSIRRRSEARVISFRRLAAWTAAALLVASAGFWVWTANKPEPGELNCETLACVEKREVLESGELENLNEDDLLQLINDEEIDKAFDAREQRTEDSIRYKAADKKEKENA